MVAPEAPEEGLVHQIFRIVHFHLQLFENDALFLLNVLRPEERLQNQLGKNVKSDRQMIVDDLGVVADQLLGGERVKVSTCRVDDSGNVFGGTAFRAFEDHVLDEMRDAVVFDSLAPRASAYPDAKADAANMRHWFGDHTEAVRQNRAVNIALIGHGKPISV